MTLAQRSYQPARDFLRVRDFLSATFRMTEKPLNWRIERWNYARYFVMPMIGAYPKEPLTVEESLWAIRWWEERIGLWENAAGDVVGVVAFEYPWPGDVFLLRHPDNDEVLTPMLDYAEVTLVDQKKRTLGLHIFEHDAAQQALAEARGYEKQFEAAEDDSVYVIRENGLPVARPPEGFVVRSMAEARDVERRREIFGRSFNHADPAEWPTAFAYEELERAPDYRPDLDLYVEGPDGQYVACCIVWYDASNHMGILEPVGTHPDFRRQGMGRAVVAEGIRRVAALGAEEVWVGSGQEFYEAIGFVKTYVSCRWGKVF